MPQVPAPTDAQIAAQAAMAHASAYAAKSCSKATLRAYKADWRHYDAWCARLGFVPAPADPKVIGAYLASMSDTHAPCTIRRRLAAIGKIHKWNNMPWNSSHGDIQGPLQGVAHEHGRPARKAAAITLDILRRILATCDDTPIGRRDRAILLFGFAGALRRSDIAGLHVEDVRPAHGGLRLRIRRSKTDQSGKGEEIGLPRGTSPETCPVRAFNAWQEVASRKAGPLFRRVFLGGDIGDSALHPDSISFIFEKRVRMAGITVDDIERLSSHGLRAGFITEAYNKGVRDDDIMRHTRHKHYETMRGYVRRAGLVNESPAKALGL